MSDYEDVDSFLESLISAAKSKRKKKLRKNKTIPEKQNKWNSSTEVDKHVQKKKRKRDTKFNEVMKGKKDKVKGKMNKKKNRPTGELDDSVVETQSSNGEAKPAVEHKTLNPLSNDELQHEQPTEEPQKRVIQKKKVAFDLTPGYIPAKRPKCSSPSQQPLKESLLEHSYTQTHHNDSQCTSDDINSQDLFITQKTFRAPPFLPSSDEAIDKAITTTPAVVQMERHHKNSFKDSHFHQQHRESIEHVQKPKRERLLLKEEKDEQRIIREEQKQTKDDLCPIYTETRVVNPYLDDPVVMLDSPKVMKLKNDSLASSKLSPTCLQPLIVLRTSASTQTENFFTTELSSFLKFGQKVKEAVHSEDMQPLDLSLPFRVRTDLRKSFSVFEEIKSDIHQNLHCPCLSDMKEETKETDNQFYSDSMQGKEERSGSSQSESDKKSAEVMISSEDSESSCLPSKLDLVQVRAVQMRLNESFFFKTKGKGHSPRPESPLMKLAQSNRKVKSKMTH